MKLSNVVGYGIGGVLCASLLSACADGRGTNGFKSYQFTKEEMAQNKLKRDGAKPQGGNNQNSGTDDTAKSGDVGTGSSTPTAALPPPPDLTSGAPVFTPGGADSKVIIQQGPANPSGVIDLTAKVQDLNLTIDEELKDGKAQNSVAKSLVKGITVTPNGTDEARTISINAVLVIGGEDVVMEAIDVPVKHLKGEERLSNMLFSLTKPCDQKPVVVKNLLQAAAKCRDEKCRGIEVILSFETQDPARRAYAVLLVAPGRDAQGKPEWQYFKTNIGTPKTFVNGLAACPAPKPADQAPAAGNPAAPAPAPGGPAVGGEMQGPPAPATPAAPKTSSLEECSKLDAEGFSVCDGEVEKNRMRSARNAAAREEAARKEQERVQGSQTPGRPSAPSQTPAAPVAPTTPFTGDGSEHTPEGPKPAPAAPSQDDADER